MKTVVTKAQYAKLKGRGPSAVSNWISEGKIFGEALIGEGNRARIWVEKADEQLAAGLDPAQQSAQDVPIQSPSSNPINDDDLRRRRRADADKAEIAAEDARRRLAIDEGRWTDAAAARQEFGRELSEIQQKWENFLFLTLARDLGEQYGLDWKAIAVRTRTLYRTFRSEAADNAKGQLDEQLASMAEAAE